MGNELATRNADTVPLRNMDDLVRLSEMFAKSGYFKDSKDAAQVGVKILAGREIGFGPFASVNGMNIIQGKPAMGANLMAAAVKASGKYDYRVRDMSPKVCRIEFFQGAESIGVSEFTLEDAKAAGTQNLSKFARNMLFARAMSNGVRWYCPDVFLGSAVYTPEELGAEVDGDGNVVKVERVALPPEARTVHDDPFTETAPAEPEPETVSPEQVKALAKLVEAAGFDKAHKDDSRSFLAFLSGSDAPVMEWPHDLARHTLERFGKGDGESFKPAKKMVEDAVVEWSDWRAGQQVEEESPPEPAEEEAHA